MATEPKPFPITTYWVVEARDVHYIYSGSGWSRQLAGSTAEHDTKAAAEAERTTILETQSFDEKELRVGKRVRHG